MPYGARKATIGLRAKTARAIAVVLCGPADSPEILKRVELRLADHHVPATGQPYHEVMELPWPEAEIAVRKTASLIQAVAAKVLAQLVRETQSEGVNICGVGIVGAPERNLEKIGNHHIRAHAAEGVLFRHVLEVAAEKSGLRKRVFEERKLNELATSELKCGAGNLDRRLSEFGRAVGPPWRADEKAAAVAAWLALTSFGRR
jgi:hypothetical protein